MAAALSTRIGSFEVRIAADEVKAFSAALELPPRANHVPLTFPMRMLASPEIAAAVAASLPEAAAVVHQAQRFISHAPLLVGATYRIEVKLESSAASPRFALSGSIVDHNGQTVQEFVTTLIVVPPR